MCYSFALRFCDKKEAINSCMIDKLKRRKNEKEAKERQRMNQELKWKPTTSIRFFFLTNNYLPRFSNFSNATLPKKKNNMHFSMRLCRRTSFFFVFHLLFLLHFGVTKECLQNFKSNYIRYISFMYVHSKWRRQSLEYKKKLSTTRSE